MLNVIHSVIAFIGCHFKYLLILCCYPFHLLTLLS